MLLGCILSELITDLELTAPKSVLFVRGIAVSGGSRISRGGANHGGSPTYYLANFSHKCMKMKKFWARRGARIPLAP